MKPLVSILIPAYNAEASIAYTLESVLAQTWQRKEIIVINDGSTDRTGEIVRRFTSKSVKCVTTENRGLSAAVNHALSFSQGDYIQELDADDLLLPDKLERQLGALHEGESKRILLSSPWAPFYYRTRSARFVRTGLWQDLSPVEWLLRKMGQNLHMQNATWLVSRELVEAAGPWDTRLDYDQDGEYYTRVLSASEGTRFIANTGIFYRASGSHRVSYVGNSDKKRESLFLSMKLHMQYLRCLEESERVRRACVAYMQNWSHHFYPGRMDLVAKLQAYAADLGGQLEPPQFRRKYAWMRPVFGRSVAERAQRTLPEFKGAWLRAYDRVMFQWESARESAGPPSVRLDLESGREALDGDSQSRARSHASKSCR
jgi:glycosyltransferase involved in cell wall biosynthesis